MKILSKFIKVIYLKNMNPIWNGQTTKKTFLRIDEVIFIQPPILLTGVSYKLFPIGGRSTKSVLSDRWIVYTKSRKQLLHRKYLFYETGCTLWKFYEWPIYLSLDLFLGWWYAWDRYRTNFQFRSLGSSLSSVPL